QNLLGGDDAVARSRRPEIMADAAHAILCQPSRDVTGRFFIDDEVLAQAGIDDLSPYRYGTDDAEQEADLFLS
ncbi:MAG: short chain dehydrogenase, partial [Actinophytocola sp.]|nr:short chain dehydrogenase [Actinophytocola sp.]